MFSDIDWLIFSCIFWFPVRFRAYISRAEYYHLNFDWVFSGGNIPNTWTQILLQEIIHKIKNTSQDFRSRDLNVSTLRWQALFRESRQAQTWLSRSEVSRFTARPLFSLSSDIKKSILCKLACCVKFYFNIYADPLYSVQAISEHSPSILGKYGIYFTRYFILDHHVLLE